MKRSLNENVSSQKEPGSNIICFPAGRVTEATVGLRKQPSCYEATVTENEEHKTKSSHKSKEAFWALEDVPGVDTENLPITLIVANRTCKFIKKKSHWKDHENQS